MRRRSFRQLDHNITFPLHCQTFFCIFSNFFALFFGVFLPFPYLAQAENPTAIYSPFSPSPAMPADTAPPSLQPRPPRPQMPQSAKTSPHPQKPAKKTRLTANTAQKNTRKSLRALCRKNTRNSLRASRRKNTRGRGGRKTFAHPFLLWYNTCIRKKYLPPRACKAERKYHVQNIADRLFGHRRPVCRRVCVRFHICQFCRRHTLRRRRGGERGLRGALASHAQGRGYAERERPDGLRCRP